MLQVNDLYRGYRFDQDICRNASASLVRKKPKNPFGQEQIQETALLDPTTSDSSTPTMMMAPTCKHKWQQKRE
ncbi:hypothetical protein VTO58DRAFT_104353 [Aureobasidium pullulans]